ncbi:MAG TPA: 23S rRNA pseudouridine(1911/1915/1917) synthase RluD, partial [Gammaproteobacteria bacterium]|nr:23S rRNA pseudouridine(1911/1915/1917) synthase RluD [Gammaproteobacteria bacterium]
HAMLNSAIEKTMIIPEEYRGMRLDQALAKLMPDYSRALIQKWIKCGSITVDQQSIKAKSLINGGETVIVKALLEGKEIWVAQPIPLNIVYQDEDIIIVNKPAGLTVHPGSGSTDNTLLNGLLHHFPALELLPRAGIIHRLDKDTTGLLVVAKTMIAYTSLSRQLRTRHIKRMYQALVSRTIISGGTVDAPIARHPLHRKRMAVIETGRPAVTHYRVLKKFREHTLLKVQLETGRTHQIRVHMSHIKHPIIGDPVYGERLRLPKNATPTLVNALRNFKRQALHADELGLTHPSTKEYMEWKIDLPEDFQNLLLSLKEDTCFSTPTGPRHLK